MLQETRRDDRMNRRSFLRGGSAVLSVPALADLFRREATAGDSAADKRSVIIVFQAGGPSHLETWDMKPNAPLEYRGEFQSIATNLPGYRIGEHSPYLARICDKLAILRSVYHDQTEHGQACHTYLTGYRPTKNDPGNEFPSCGSIVSKLLGRRDGVPAYVATMQTLPSGNAGYLGIAHNPFQTFGYPTSPTFHGRNLKRPDGVDARRLDDRRAMLQRFDTLRREVDASGSLEGMDTFTRQAFEMVASPKVQQALDLNKECPKLRARYGDRSFGAQSMLLSRRLVEGGARFVTVRVDGQWDSHKDNFPAHRNLLPPFDQAVSALIEDLDQRGLLATTLVIIGGEFGRTPKINKDAGRDHWPTCYSTVMAGGGIRGGIVLGESDALGENPKTRPIHHQDVLATMYHQLGIDWKSTFSNEAQRPVEILNNGTPIREIL
jgi:Protein of unknown function (DUF1501)